MIPAFPIEGSVHRVGINSHWHGEHSFNCAVRVNPSLPDTTTLADPSDIWREVADVNRRAIDCWRSRVVARDGMDRESHSRHANVRKEQLVGTVHQSALV